MIRVRVSPEEHIDWKKQAKEGGVSMSELIRSRMNVATDVATEHVKVHKKAPPTPVIPPKKKAIEEAVAKAEKIKPTTFRSYFKDNKLNKG